MISNGVGRMWGWVVVLTVGVAAGPSVGGEPAGEPVAVRAESFVVPPSTQPLVYVAVKNLRDTPYQGVVKLKTPAGWRIAPAEREVSLGAGEVKRVAFTVEKGVTTAANAYAVEVTAVGAGVTVVRKQTVVCASAVYFKPTIDGEIADWKDAIPVTFTTGGKKTVIHTYWNRRALSLLVAVEEDRVIGYRPEGRFDAVQVAIAPRGAPTSTSPGDKATRYEFLFAGAGAEAKCFKLAEPGMRLAEAAKPRTLAPLAFDGAKVVVRRVGKVTYYECAIPFKLMREKIQPTEGREFCLSVCVHDPDGTGIRDWGEAAGLWPRQRNRLAWCDWRGGAWGKKWPFDSKIEWGMCASKY